MPTPPGIRALIRRIGVPGPVRSEPALALYVAANVIWVAAVVRDGLALTYLVADLGCTAAAVFLWMGARRQAAGLFASGGVASALCNVPFTIDGFAEGGTTAWGQVAFLASCAGFVLAAASARAEALGMRAGGALLALTGLLWFAGWSDWANLWNVGNGLTVLVGAWIAARPPQLRSAG